MARKSGEELDLDLDISAFSFTSSGETGGPPGLPWSSMGSPVMGATSGVAPKKYVPPPPKFYGPFYIVQKLNNTYLTYNKSMTTADFKPLLKSKAGQKFQQWFIPRSSYAEGIYKKREINKIFPFANKKKCLCMNETTDGLMIKDETTKSMCVYWTFEDFENHLYNDAVYEDQIKIGSAKFNDMNMYTPFRNRHRSRAEKAESCYLTLSTDPNTDPVFIKTGPIISYDFDGVLHVSVKQDPNFHRELKRATFHPVDFTSDKDLVPYDEMIDQLIADAQEHQIIIVTARPNYSDKAVRAFLKRVGLEEVVSHIFYISNKTPFLKALDIVKHYDDSPKHIIPMTEAGIDVVPVVPMVNRYWESKTPGWPKV
jgi:hypothetical protein